jgi:hypothetical protein
VGKRLVFLSSLLTVATGLGVGAFLSLRRGPVTAELPADVLSFPADTVAVLGLDVRYVVGHPLYQRIRSLTGLEETWQAVDRDFGHQPERDVDRGYLGCTSLTPHGSRCLLILRGRFDAGRLAAVASAPGWRKVGRRGLPNYVRSDGASLVLLDDSTLAVATAPDLLHGLVTDRRAGRHGIRGNAAMMASLASVKPGTTLWLVSALDSFSTIQREFGGLRGLPSLDGLQGLTLTAGFDGVAQVEATLTARDEDAAKAVSGVLGLALGALTLAGDRAELAELTSRVNVTTEGRQVHVRAQLSYDAVERLAHHR